MTHSQKRCSPCHPQQQPECCTQPRVLLENNRQLLCCTGPDTDAKKSARCWGKDAEFMLFLFKADLARMYKFKLEFGSTG